MCGAKLVASAQEGVVRCAVCNFLNDEMTPGRATIAFGFLGSRSYQA